MKKVVIASVVVILMLVGVYFVYTYYNKPKIVDGVVSKSIDDNGKPLSIATEFSKEEAVHFFAKSNRFWIKKAQIVWYKEKHAKENRFLIEEGIDVNDAGYFFSKLSVPEGLETGHYFVNIYVDGKDIIETGTEFEVK
ncbi:hypothetical protein [Clostridium algidicarnis]|uniref:hypothetical protein n=1 Tax=Clostridium algidicarnis TaxID=37659 RepID=UPI0004981C7E|nr:hypothetical protein [Clostridium algidicarnis]MBB6696587.1 hypothetical protein [Clostridium algidicarnis]